MNNWLQEKFFAKSYKLRIGAGNAVFEKPRYYFSYADYCMIRTVLEGDYLLSLERYSDSYFSPKQVEQLKLYRSLFVNKCSGPAIIKIIENDNWVVLHDRKYQVCFEEFNPRMRFRKTINDTNFDWDLIYNAAVYVASYRFPHQLPISPITELSVYDRFCAYTKQLIQNLFALKA